MEHDAYVLARLAVSSSEKSVLCRVMKRTAE